MSVSEQTQQFMQLFRGRTDALGTDAGGCVKTIVTDLDYERHLNGPTPIGVYPTYEQNGQFVCSWGCVDIDFPDFRLALSLRTCLEALDIQAHIEQSRSKGYHVWVFADTAVEAVVMRHALQAVCQIIGYSPKEVNPKQVTLTEGQLGNYVRLPYPAGATGAQMMVPPDKSQFRMSLDEWLKTVDPTHPARFKAAAALYVEPPKPKPIVVPLQERTIEGDLTDKLNGLAWTIYKNGPLDGADRSGTLAKLAHECQRSGLTPAEALAIVTDADRVWGKYWNRADGQLQLQRLVQAAY